MKDGSNIRKMKIERWDLREEMLNLAWVSEYVRNLEIVGSAHPKEVDRKTVWRPNSL